MCGWIGCGKVDFVSSFCDCNGNCCRNCSQRAKRDLAYALLLNAFLTAAPSSTASAALFGNGKQFFGWCTRDPASEIFTRWIVGLADDLSINHHDWQAVGASAAQKVVNRLVFNEGLWLLGKVVALNAVPLVLEPVEIRSELW